MSWTKRQLVLKAFAKLGMASYAYDLEPEELQGALTDLDAMMSEWSDEGVQIGYPITTSPENADLDTETGIPSGAASAVFHSLAVRIAPDYGKTVSQTVQAAATSGFKTLQGRNSKPPKVKSQLTPAGQGHQASRRNRGSYYNNYLPQNPDNRVRGLEDESVTFKKG